jgi:hypothetical protein
MFALNRDPSHCLFHIYHRIKSSLLFLLGFDRLEILFSSSIQIFLDKFILWVRLISVWTRPCKLTERKKEMALPRAVLTHNEGECASCLLARRTGTISRNSLANIVTPHVALTRLRALNLDDQ